MYIPECTYKKTRTLLSLCLNLVGRKYHVDADTLLEQHKPPSAHFASLTLAVVSSLPASFGSTAAMTQRKWAATPAANSAGTEKSVSKINNQIIVRAGSCSVDAYEQRWSQSVRELSAVDLDALECCVKVAVWWENRQVALWGKWTLSAADSNAVGLMDIYCLVFSFSLERWFLFISFLFFSN